VLGRLLCGKFHVITRGYRHHLKFSGERINHIQALPPD
jgi:hypothetical protein